VRGEIAHARPVIARRASDEAIDASTCRAMDCFAALAMTVLAQTRRPCEVITCEGARIELGENIMAKAVFLSVFMLALISTGASAKDTRFWNLTANTITSLQLSPSGKNAWGRNQTDNDRDHTVDHDERLKITDTEAGTYDVKIVDQSGRTCIVPNVQVKAGSIFSIEEKELKGCTR
jgi:membrane protein implicated in regulation of membrane protease activity